MIETIISVAPIIFGMWGYICYMWGRADQLASERKHSKKLKASEATAGRA